MEPALRVVFLGTSTFAIPILRTIHVSPHRLSMVVTRPSKQAGRGRRLRMPPVAEEAMELGLPLLQPEKLNADFIAELRTIAPDIMVSADYGAWLPEELLKCSLSGVMNVHPSLLPKHRGAAPVARAILDGDTVTGVTFMLTDMGWDTGPVIEIIEEPVRPDDTAGSLESRLSELAAAGIVRVMEDFVSRRLRPLPQIGESDYADKLTTEETWLDWERPAAVLERTVRAFQPVPGARTTCDGKLLKITGSAVSGMMLEPGRINVENGLIVGCGTGSLEILELQPEGRRTMTAKEYLRGSRLRTGERLG